jgi:hypothetical protein
MAEASISASGVLLHAMSMMARQRRFSTIVIEGGCWFPSISHIYNALINCQTWADGVTYIHYFWFA